MMNRKGFTLIELMIILVVIGILVAVGLPRFTSFIEEGRITAADQHMTAVISAVKMFEMHMRYIPTCVAHLVVTPPAADYKDSDWSNVETWKGPYMEGQPDDICMDPWGHPYIIYYNAEAGNYGYLIFSFGPDGIKGTADDIQKWLRYDGPNGLIPAKDTYNKSFDEVPESSTGLSDTYYPLSGES